MAALNIISTVVLVLVAGASVGLKLYTHRFLSDIDGLGDVEKRGDTEDNVILKL